MAALCTFKLLFSVLEKKFQHYIEMDGKEFDRKIGRKNYSNAPSVTFMQ